MTHRDRAGDATGQWAGRRGAAGDAGYRQGLPTPPAVRPLPVRPRDRHGGFPNALRPGLSDGAMLVDGAHGLRCRGIAAPRAPGRKPQPGSMGEAVSMGHYQRDLV